MPQSRDTYFEWLYFDTPLEDRRPLAEHLLERQARTLHPRVADYIRLMLSTAMRPYRVRHVTPGEGLRLRDLFTGDEIDVRERSGSRQLVVWDALVARLHRHSDGSTQLEGSMIALPRAGDVLSVLLEHDDFQAGPHGSAAWVERAGAGTRRLGEVDPALDGATPREAARSRRLRNRLVDLLIDLENHAARLALSGTSRDVSWMWRELGLKRP